jgi:STE24 endopeptidase
MHPGPVEEFRFFDHPSGWQRIHRAMIWKAENLDDPMVRSGEAITPAGAR